MMSGENKNAAILMIIISRILGNPAIFQYDDHRLLGILAVLSLDNHQILGLPTVANSFPFYGIPRLRSTFRWHAGLLKRRVDVWRGRSVQTQRVDAARRHGAGPGPT